MISVQQAVNQRRLKYYRCEACQVRWQFTVDVPEGLTTSERNAYTRSYAVDCWCCGTPTFPDKPESAG